MTTSLLMWVGLICLLAADWGRWRQLPYRRTLPEIFAMAKEGRLPKREPWRKALTVLGLALGLLSLLRSCSGV